MTREVDNLAPLDSAAGDAGMSLDQKQELDLLDPPKLPWFPRSLKPRPAHFFFQR